MTHIEGQRWVATPSAAVTAAVLARRDDPLFRERFYAKVDTRELGDDECHIWTGALSSEGYGNFTVGPHTVRAHRVAWIIEFGDVPGDDFLDHVHPICRYRFCVRTMHLDPVDNQENCRRGVGIGRLGQRSMRWHALDARNAADALREGKQAA